MLSNIKLFVCSFIVESLGGVGDGVFSYFYALLDYIVYLVTCSFIYSFLFIHFFILFVNDWFILVADFTWVLSILFFRQC